MKLTPANIGKAVGYALLVAGTGFGAFRVGRAAPAEAATVPAQSTISAPAVTAADIVSLRDHLDRKFEAQDKRLRAVETGFANVQGYMEAQREARGRVR